MPGTHIVAERASDIGPSRTTTVFSRPTSNTETAAGTRQCSRRVAARGCASRIDWTTRFVAADEKTPPNSGGGRPAATAPRRAARRPNPRSGLERRLHRLDAQARRPQRADQRARAEPATLAGSGGVEQRLQKSGVTRHPEEGRREQRWKGAAASQSASWFWRSPSRARRRSRAVSSRRETCCASAAKATADSPHPYRQRASMEYAKPKRDTVERLRGRPIHSARNARCGPRALRPAPERRQSRRAAQFARAAAAAYAPPPSRRPAAHARPPAPHRAQSCQGQGPRDVEHDPPRVVIDDRRPGLAFSPACSHLLQERLRIQSFFNERRHKPTRDTSSQETDQRNRVTNATEPHPPTPTHLKRQTN